TLGGLTVRGFVCTAVAMISSFDICRATVVLSGRLDFPTPWMDLSSTAPPLVSEPVPARKNRFHIIGNGCLISNSLVNFSFPKGGFMVSTSQRSPVALVTGSGQKRVGWHVANALAQRGYNLAIHYRSSAQEAAETVAFLQSLGVQAVSLHADLTDEVQVQGLIQRVVEQFGRIDVLANCAAIWKSKKLEEIRAADVRLHFETNLLGTFLCCQQAGLAMIRQSEGGCIINIGDWAVARPYLNYAAYFPSKGAIP